MPKKPEPQGETYEAIAKEFGVTREGARQLVFRALGSFRAELNRRGYRMEDLTDYRPPLIAPDFSCDT